MDTFKIQQSGLRIVIHLFLGTYFPFVKKGEREEKSKETKRNVLSPNREENDDIPRPSTKSDKTDRCDTRRMPSGPITVRFSLLPLLVI